MAPFSAAPAAKHLTGFTWPIGNSTYIRASETGVHSTPCTTSSKARYSSKHEAGSAHMQTTHVTMRITTTALGIRSPEVTNSVGTIEPPLVVSTMQSKVETESHAFETVMTSTQSRWAVATSTTFSTVPVHITPAPSVSAAAIPAAHEARDMNSEAIGITFAVVVVVVMGVLYMWISGVGQIRKYLAGRKAKGHAQANSKHWYSFLRREREPPWVPTQMIEMSQMAPESTISAAASGSGTANT